MRRQIGSIPLMLAMALTALMTPMGVWASPLAQMEVLGILAGQDPVSDSIFITNDDSLDIFASTHIRRAAPANMQTAQSEVSAIYAIETFHMLIGQTHHGHRLTMNGFDIDDYGLKPSAAQGVGVPAAGHLFEPQVSPNVNKTNYDAMQMLIDALAGHPRPAALEVGAVYIGNTDAGLSPFDR